MAATICAICGKTTLGKSSSPLFTIRESYIQAGGFGSIPMSARVHVRCDEHEQRLLKSGKLTLEALWTRTQLKARGDL